MKVYSSAIQAPVNCLRHSAVNVGDALPSTFPGCSGSAITDRKGKGILMNKLITGIVSALFAGAVLAQATPATPAAAATPATPAASADKTQAPAEAKGQTKEAKSKKSTKKSSKSQPTENAAKESKQ